MFSLGNNPGQHGRELNNSLLRGYSDATGCPVGSGWELGSLGQWGYK